MSAAPTLKQFRYLVALADTAHFRRAAEVSGVSQPSLSAQIQALEEALGHRLVERGRGGVHFTPIGREVLERARQVVVDTQAIVDVADTAGKGLRGRIRLGVKATLGPYLLPRIVAELRKAHPESQLYIREGVPARLEDELTRGVHDVILAQLPLRSGDLVTRPLFHEPILFAVSSQHPLAAKGSVSVRDLKGLPVLSLAPDLHLHDQVLALCHEFGAKVIGDYEGNSLDALRQMVSMNIGTTFLPALYAQSELAGLGDVVALPFRGRRVFRSIGLVWRRGAGRVAAYEDLAAFIRQTAPEVFDGLVFDGQ